MKRNDNGLGSLSLGHRELIHEHTALVLFNISHRLMKPRCINIDFFENES